MRNLRLYNIWSCMRQRCNNPKNTAARWYHNRGIRVCTEWEKNFQTFETWALCNGYSDNLTIDRIDPDGNYCPENCRWISRSENAKRVRHSLHITKKQKKEPQTKKEPKPKTGRFMVVSTHKHVPFPLSFATVIKIGLTKPEAGKYANELKRTNPYGPNHFWVYVAEGYKEGDVVYEKNLAHYIKSK